MVGREIQHLYPMQLSQTFNEAVRSSARRSARVVCAALCVAFVAAQGAAVGAAAVVQKAAPKKQEASKAQRKADAPAAQRGTVPAATLLRIVRAEDERHWEEQTRCVLSTRAPRFSAARRCLGPLGDKSGRAALDASASADAGCARCRLLPLLHGAASARTRALNFGLSSRRSYAGAGEALGKIAALPSAQCERSVNWRIALDFSWSGSRRIEPLRPAHRTPLPCARARPRRKDGATSLSSTDRVCARRGQHARATAPKDGVDRCAGVLDTDPSSAPTARAPRRSRRPGAFVGLPIRRRPTPTRACAERRPIARAPEEPAAADQLIARQQCSPTTDWRVRQSSSPAPAEQRLLDLRRRSFASLAQKGTRSHCSGAPRGGGRARNRDRAARIAPGPYLRDKALADLVNGRGGRDASWQKISAVGQGLGELAALTSALVGNSAVAMQADAQIMLRSLIDGADTPALAVPDLLRSLAAFKPGDLAGVARAKLTAHPVIVRAAAATSSRDPPDDESARGSQGRARRARDGRTSRALGLGALRSRGRGVGAA